MKRWTAICILLFVAIALGYPKSSAAQEQAVTSEGKRKVTSRVMPDYPEMARRMSLKGTVKVDVIVSSNGTVKNVELKGGHPVLAQAALSAVKKWKWEPATHETHEPIEVRFDPQ
jgi:TonB family protein